MSSRIKRVEGGIWVFLPDNPPDEVVYHGRLDSFATGQVRIDGQKKYEQKVSDFLSRCYNEDNDIPWSLRSWNKSSETPCGGSTVVRYFGSPSFNRKWKGALAHFGYVSSDFFHRMERS